MVAFSKTEYYSCTHFKNDIEYIQWWVLNGAKIAKNLANVEHYVCLLGMTSMCCKQRREHKNIYNVYVHSMFLTENCWL